MRFFYIYLKKFNMNLLKSLDIPGTLKNVWLIISSVIFIITASLFLLPEDILLNNTPVCQSKTAEGAECIACGLTRGFVNIYSGNFSEANHFNHASLPLYGLFLLNNIVFTGFTLKKLFIKIIPERGNT